MLGPYLRPVLYWTIGISVVVCALIFGMAARARNDKDQEDLLTVAVGWLVSTVSIGGLTLFLHFMGMP
jgi:hypothetical protein